MKNEVLNRFFLSRPLATIALFFIAGIYGGRTCEIDYLTALLFLTFLTFLLLVSFLYFKDQFPYLLLLLFFPLGLCLSQVNSYIYSGQENISRFASQRKITVEGRVIERDDRGSEKKLLIETEKVFEEKQISPVKGRLLLTLAAGGEYVVPGNSVRFRGKLKVPRNFGNPGNFDYEKYLHDRGIYATSYLKDDASLSIIGKGGAVWDRVYSYRRKVGDAIAESTLKESGGIIKAITIGDRSHIEEMLLAVFRKSGVAHLLAISGLHMGIVAYFFFRLFKWIFSRSERLLLYNAAGKPAALLTLIPLSLYLLASGMATSAVRAYIMVVIFLFSVIMERETDIYNTIAFAVLVILFMWPMALFDVGFQLSFVAVLSIVYLVPKFESLLKIDKKGKDRTLLDRITTFAIVSFAASLGTAPLTACYFTEVSFSAVFSNLLIVPLGGFIAVPLSSLGLFFSLFSMEIAKFMFFLASAVMKVPVWLSGIIASVPGSSTIVIPPSAYEIFCYYLLLVFVFSTVRKIVFASLLVVPALYFSFSYWEHDRLDGKETLEVTFISVGQGESTFIHFPGGKTMLVDGGGFYNNAFDVGRMVLRPFLLAQGVKSLDYLVITHPHPDHMYGLLHIIKEFAVGQLWINGLQAGDGIYKEILATSDSRNISKRVISDKSPDLEIEGVKVAFLHPPSARSVRRRSDSNINNESIVMKLTFGEQSFLFTGDLEKKGEKRLLRAGYDLKSDVIKVAHHGSLTSSTQAFVNAVAPEYAVFSVGYNNRFHFPRDEISNRFRAAGSTLLRTDISGAITFITDGAEMEMRTFRE